MFKIQTLNAISPIGLTQFPTSHYQISDHLTDPDAILVRSHILTDTSIPASVIAIARAGAGVNNIPVTAMTQRGIPVFNTPGANANAVRELVIAGMLLCSRHICQAWQYVNHLKGDDAALNKQIEQDKKQFAGFELMGKTIGVVGLGSIGVKVANAALHLGMRVIGYDPTISVSRAWELSANVQQAHHLSELLSQSDFITFHVPLMEETKHMINASNLNLLKPNAVLLNFARDGIIDNLALLDSLNQHKIQAYVTDFPAANLQHHGNVICLPHLGASTVEAEENCAVMAVKQLREYLELGVINNAVNFPSIDLPTNEASIRLAIVNENIPNMVAQMSSVLGAAGMNIISLVNKSRDTIAYTVIDIGDNATDSLINSIKQIKGVIQVRKLKLSFSNRI